MMKKNPFVVLQVYVLIREMLLLDAYPVVTKQ